MRRGWWIAALAVFAGEGPADERPLEELVRAAAVAEVEVTRRDEGAGREVILQLRVRRQAGLVELPARLHVLLVDRDWELGKAPAPWWVRANAGTVRTVGLNRGGAGVPWCFARDAEKPDWKAIEAAYALRKRLAGCGRDELAGRLARMMKGDDLQRRAAVAHLIFDPWDPPPEAIALCAGLDPEGMPYTWTTRHGGRLFRAFVEAWKKKPLKEVANRWRTPVTDKTVWAHDIAETALCEKAAAGDEEAVTFWVERLRSGRDEGLDYLFVEALGKATGRPEVRRAFIERFERTSPETVEGVRWLACLCAGGKEGFDYTADCLTGVRKPEAAREFARQGLYWFYMYQDENLVNPACVERATELLAHRESHVRGFAAHHLGLVRHAASAEKLTALVEDAKETPATRMAAMRAMLRMDDATALKFCRRVLASKEPLLLKKCRLFHNDAASDVPVKGYAIGRLGTIDTPESFVLLGDALRSGDATARYWAGNALARHRSAEATKVFEKEYADSRGKDAERARAAVSCLIGQNTAAARKALVRIAAGDDAEARRSIWQAALADPGRTAELLADYSRRRQAGRTPEKVCQIGRCMKGLDSDEFERREAATRELAALGLATVPELMEARASGNMEPRDRAKRLLDRVHGEGFERALASALLAAGSKDHATLQVELLASPEPVVRVLAIEGLRAVTGRSLEYDPLAEEGLRRKAVLRWRAHLRAK